METLAGFSPERKRDLVREFLHGYAPGGLEPSKLEELRLWPVHSILGWVMLPPPTEEEIRVATYSMRRCGNPDDPAEWF